MRYTEVCNVKISEGRQGKIDNAEMQETCYTFAEKLGGNEMWKRDRFYREKEAGQSDKTMLDTKEQEESGEDTPALL